MIKTKCYKILFLLTSLGLCSGCNDFFDVDPVNALKTDDYYKNTNDLNGGAYGIYSCLAPEVHKLMLWGSARADLVLSGEGNDAYAAEFVNNDVSPLNPYTDYSFLYKAIARCNHHLNNIPKVKPSDVTTPKRLEPFYGEAYLIRAWCYFQLVRTFEKVPLVVDEITENVTYVNREGQTVSMNTLELSEDEIRSIALQPVEKQEIWKQITSDLNKALLLLQPDIQWYPGLGWTDNYNTTIRANLADAYTLATEVALWRKDYAEASGYADGALALISTPGSASTWFKQYTDENPSPQFALSIFGYTYEGGFKTQRLQEFTSPVEEDGGLYLLKPCPETIDNLLDEGDDVRKKFTWKQINRKDVIWKYIGLDEDGKSMREPYRSVAPWYKYHTSEVYLLKGIAENRIGRTGTALEMLNMVRNARKLIKLDKDKIPMDMISMENLLFKERARETAYEGKRWYDLLLMEEVFGRQGILAETVSAKYSKDKRAEMYQRLMNRSSWYLPIEPERWK